MFGAVLWFALERDAAGSECPLHSQGDYHGDAARPIDAVPWSTISVSDLPSLTAASCSFFVTSGPGEPVGATVVVDPQEVEVLEPDDELVVWFQPEVAFQPETAYSLSCGAPRLSFDDVEFRTSTREAAPVPVLALTSAREVDQGMCCGGTFLQLSLADVSETFFDDGGVLLLEYSGGRRSYASQAYGQSSVDAPQPSDGDEVIVVTPISGRHEVGAAIPIDVASVRSSSSCAQGRLTASTAWLGLLLLCRRRSRDAVSGAEPRRTLGSAHGRRFDQPSRG